MQGDAIIVEGREAKTIREWLPVALELDQPSRLHQVNIDCIGVLLPLHSPLQSASASAGLQFFTAKERGFVLAR